MKIGILKETTETEQRVALVPQIAQLLSKQKVEWIVESGAGIAAGFKDSDYADHGMVILNSAAEVLEQAEIVIHISPIMFKKIAEFSRQSGKRIVSIGMTDSLWIKDLFAVHGNKNLISFSLDLMPRISRAQSMDVLSSMSTISGFKAVLLAADRLTKVIPMLTTAAGTIPPCKGLGARFGCRRSSSNGDSKTPRCSRFRVRRSGRNSRSNSKRWCKSCPKP
ncbi:MAG TPA: hypothetical protein VGQ08_14035 [Nitrospiraceae bacterium]|nr:hypothetical protein [Nitrospiraceae bacterium]